MERTCSVTQSWPTLHDPIDCSLPGSSVHGIFQARIMEWVAISFSRKELGPQIKKCSEEQECILTTSIRLICSALVLMGSPPTPRYGFVFPLSSFVGSESFWFIGQYFFPGYLEKRDRLLSQKIWPLVSECL